MQDNQKENLKVIEHTRCRLCGSQELENAFSLGTQYVNNFVNKEDIGKGIKAPLTLVLCSQCTLIQLKHTAPQELLYSRYYWYRSGVTDTMKKELRDISQEIEEFVSFRKNDVVLDIGANDGTLLDTFSNRELTMVGCEPADNLLPYLKQSTDYVMHDFWSYESYQRHAKNWGIGKAKVVTALGMFYDLDDPNKFIGDVKKVLETDGIFVAQLMCLANMLKQNDLGNICHEHIEFYSLDSLKFMFEKNGLEIFKIEENMVNGGSYRIFARHYEKGTIKYQEKIGMVELLEFKKRIDTNRDKCTNFIKKEVSKGKSVCVYGASTKGNVILQYYDLGPDLITAAAERSPEKYGKFTIGSWIPIISEEEARNLQPDYFLVLPVAFFDEFYEREKEWRSKGGKFILPLPEFKVVE